MAYRYKAGIICHFIADRLAEFSDPGEVARREHSLNDYSSSPTARSISLSFVSVSSSRSRLKRASRPETPERSYRRSRLRTLYRPEGVRDRLRVMNAVWWSRSRPFSTAGI